MRTIRLQVVLRDVAPVVMRVIDVPMSTTLPELHQVLQAATGWTDCHLHQFDTATTSYGPPDPDGELSVVEERGVLVRHLPAEFVYLYDFGDGWHHDVTVLGSGDAEVGCRYGEGVCPPEDCGGPHGYAHLQAVLADPSHPEYAELRAWTGEPKPFDQAVTDALVRKTVGLVPAGVRLVLDLLGDGVRLTPAGRLPRVFVRAVQQQRPEWAWSDRPASIEDDLVPLAALHDVLCEVGLVRLTRGVLRRTRAADDEVAVVRRLRSWFDLGTGSDGGFTRVLSGWSVAVLAGDGPRDPRDVVRAVLPIVGERWSVSGRTISEDDLRLEMAKLLPVWRALDLVNTPDRCWTAGSSARSLLPLAIAVAHLRAPAPAPAPAAS